MKNKFLTISTLIALLAASVAPPASAHYAQDKQAKSESKQASPPTTSTPVRTPLAFGLEDGTPVRMRLTRTISSADAKVGDTVDFEVLEEIKIGDAVIVPRGAIAWGTVTEAQPKRRMGRA